jgi:uncharacterized membrane protein YheB (UPF0754 family)
VTSFLTADLATLVPWVQGWSEIKDDFSVNWLVYLSMPFVAAFVGWSTKIVALEMLYRPVERRGIGPFAWQGIVPRRAGKVAATTIELLTQNLLKPEELLDKIDPAEAVEQLREPLVQAIAEITPELAEQIRPGLWASLPEAGRRAIQARVLNQAPKVGERLLAEMRSDLSRYVDIQFLAVTTLIRNKDKLNDLMRSLSTDAMAFVRRAGIYFGLGIGVVQMVAWAVFQNPWIMPAFGFGVGFVSDYIALNMLFRPLRPTRYLGLVTFQGLLHANREKITRDYAKILAEDLFSPENLFEGIFGGPGADKLYSLVAKEVSAAIDAQTGVVTPLVTLAIGSRRYREMKATAAQLIIDRLPATLADAQDYTMSVIDLEGTIVEKMSQLDNDEYESILRPVFKDDEPLMISVGAVLGGIVGEIQVQVIEHFGR